MMMEGDGPQHAFHNISEGTESSIAVECVVLPGPRDRTLGSTLGTEAYVMLQKLATASKWVDDGKCSYLVLLNATRPDHQLPKVKGTQTFASVFCELGCPQECIAKATDRRSHFTEEEKLALIELSQRARAAVYTVKDRAKWAPQQVGPTSVFCWPPWPWHMLHGKTVENRMAGFKTVCTLLAKGCSITANGECKYGLCPLDVSVSCSWVTETRKRDPAFSKKRKREPTSE